MSGFISDALLDINFTSRSFVIHLFVLISSFVISVLPRGDQFALSCIVICPVFDDQPPPPLSSSRPKPRSSGVPHKKWSPALIAWEGSENSAANDSVHVVMGRSSGDE